jgi:hypothetical protein
MIFSVLAKQIFFTCSKMKLLTNFMIFVATKNGGTKRIPPPLSSFGAGSRIRNTGWRGGGAGIHIV